MSRVSLIALAGFRIREREMLDLGMKLPALAARAGAVGALPALGLLTLAGLVPRDWEVAWHEPAAVDDGLIDAIVAERPTLAAISALTASIGEAYRLGDALRREGIRVVIGGLHVTSCPDEAAMHADAVVIGDGEPVWPEVLADAAAGRLRQFYRAAGPFDLRGAPMPRFDLLGRKERPRFTVQTARGCPLACEFCGASRLLGPFREKPAALVERELEAVRAVARRAGVRRPTVELADDNTFAGGRDAGELLGALERSGVRWFTECDWRIGERPEVLERLAAAGCVQVLVGFESLASRVPGMGAKGAGGGGVRRMMEAAERIQEAGVAVIGCFVVGADGEDHESLSLLMETAVAAPLADIQITVQTPFPGTALRRRLEREGRLLPERGWESCTLFDVAYRPDRLSVGELERGFRNVVAGVFAAGPSARREGIRREVWAKRGEGRGEEAGAVNAAVPEVA